jgi:hypothetical protein
VADDIGVRILVLLVFRTLDDISAGTGTATSAEAIELWIVIDLLFLFDRRFPLGSSS